MKEEIEKIYIEDGRLRFLTKEGKEYGIMYDYTGIGGVLEEVDICEFVDEKDWKKEPKSHSVDVNGNCNLGCC